MRDWYQIPEEEALAELGSRRTGLGETEAEKRQERYGRNVLRESGRKPWWKIFLAQFQDLLVQILIAAAVISMVSGNGESTLVIFAVLILNAVLGTVQHEKAQKSLESLKALSAPAAQVMRDGRRQLRPAAELVPGDILILEAGDLAAADGRLIEAHGLRINESSLTGEAESVEKQTRAIRKETPLADRDNMVFSGGLVTGGRGLAVVTATGMETEIGRIAELMNQTKEQRTPLQISLDRFSSRLAAAILGISAVVFLLGIYRGSGILDSLMFAVALAVAAIPEALGTIVTIVQAMGTQRMARQNAIIKDLKAVESLGCVSVICTDKTGTLTQNRMTAQAVYSRGRAWRLPLPPEFWRMDGIGELSLMDAAVLANNAELSREGEKSGPAPGGAPGDPTEIALLAMAADAGIDPAAERGRWARLEELPFDSERKRMSVVCRRGSGPPLLIAKGAPDGLVPRCSRIEAAGGTREMTAADRRGIGEQNEAWGREGLRVLALAWKPETGREEGDRETDLIFLGLAALMDPPRPESRAAVEKAREAGMKPVMITGDHPVTALSIAEKTGILRPGETAVTGRELDGMSDGELDARLPGISVCARVSPEHKIRIVEAWQRKGKVVAMTGDGVNDAPALKKADIGVAMGLTGTEVSRDAASMILADDNFATIIAAVENGRNVYRNIRNAIDFLLSGNMAGIFCVLYTSMLALPMPFAPVHLLFINLVTDSLPALAIGMEPAEDGLLRQKPRDPSKGILTRSFLKDILIQGGLIAGCTMGAYYVGLFSGIPDGGGTAAASGLRAALQVPQALAGGIRMLWEQAAAAASALAGGDLGSALAALAQNGARSGGAAAEVLSSAPAAAAGNPAVASTMAFTTLTLARLFHGFNCRSHHSILHLGLSSNLYSVMAFEAGAVLLAAVLFVPGFQRLFAAADLTLFQVAAVAGFALVPTLIIQAWKAARESFR